VAHHPSRGPILEISFENFIFDNIRQPLVKDRLGRAIIPKVLVVGGLMKCLACWRDGWLGHLGSWGGCGDGVDWLRWLVSSEHCLLRFEVEIFTLAAVPCCFFSFSPLCRIWPSPQNVRSRDIYSFSIFEFLDFEISKPGFFQLGPVFKSMFANGDRGPAFFEEMYGKKEKNQEISKKKRKRKKKNVPVEYISILRIFPDFSNIFGDPSQFWRFSHFHQRKFTNVIGGLGSGGGEASCLFSLPKLKVFVQILRWFDHSSSCVRFMGCALPLPPPPF